MKAIGRLRWLLLSALLPCVAAFAAPMTEQQKIDALIHDVETTPGVKFIRNGTPYDGKAAASHLRLKLHSAGICAKSAEQFISYCASTSSMSGKPYEVELADGRRTTAEVFFHADLKRIEAQPAPAANH